MRLKTRANEDVRAENQDNEETILNIKINKNIEKTSIYIESKAICSFFKEMSENKTIDSNSPLVNGKIFDIISNKAGEKILNMANKLFSLDIDPRSDNPVLISFFAANSSSSEFYAGRRANGIMLLSKDLDTGITIEADGAYTKKELETWAETLIGFCKNLYNSYLKPVSLNYTISSIKDEM